MKEITREQLTVVVTILMKAKGLMEFGQAIKVVSIIGKDTALEATTNKLLDAYTVYLDEMEKIESSVNEKAGIKLPPELEKLMDEAEAKNATRN